MSELNVMAIMYPAPGKVDRIKELMADVIKKVHATEKEGTLRYLLWENLRSPEPEMYMIETYTDKAALDAHSQTEHFKTLFASFEKEGVFAKPPYLALASTVLGFDIGHAFVGSSAKP